LPPFAEFLRARVVAIDGPPMTPVLSNPLTIILAAIGLYRVLWKPEINNQHLAILRLALLGHAAAVLILAFFVTVRFRFDFAPFMILAALIGYSSISVAYALPASCPAITSCSCTRCIAG
jgi:hypothetical protein